MRKIILTTALSGLLVLGGAAPALAGEHLLECEDVQAIVGGHHTFDCEGSGELPLP